MSGEWFGEIPQHWESEKIGALFTERRTKVSDKDYAPLSVAKIGVVPQLETAVKTDAGDNRKLVCKGDFVINSRSDRKGSCGVSKLDGSVSLINIVLTPRGQLSGGYTHYLLRSQPFAEEYYRNGRGIVSDLWTTRYSEMKSIMLPVPPRDEQEQIVRFLDWKVSAINRLIAVKRKQISIIEELKLSEIKQNFSVLNINDTAKIRLKNIASTFGRIGFRGYSTADLVDEREGAITTSPSNIKQENVEFDKCSYLSWEKYEESPEIQLCQYDILLVKTGSSYGKTGFIANDLTYPATINPQLTIIRNKREDVLPKYLYFAMKYGDIQTQIRKNVIGSTIPTISESRISNLNLLLPKRNAQINIIDNIQSIINKFHILTSNIENEISVLQDLKARLISDVVTGKIDVRGVEVPEYETVEKETGEEETALAEEEANEQA